MTQLQADNKTSMVGAGLHYTKCTFHHVPENINCQVISLWMQASYAIKLLCLIVYYTPVTSNCFNIEM